MRISIVEMFLCHFSITLLFELLHVFFLHLPSEDLKLQLFFILGLCSPVISCLLVSFKFSVFIEFIYDDLMTTETRILLFTKSSLYATFMQSITRFDDSNTFSLTLSTFRTLETFTVI